jgi:L-rhamnose mutarotase
MIKSTSKEELLGACGESIRAMKHVANELKEMGITTYALLLDNAQKKLYEKSLYFFEDTEPIEIK